MTLKEGYIYHIFNQGNNRRRIFFSDNNYFYFLEKAKRHMLPYGSIIAYCLMPNHFHFMLYVSRLNVQALGRGKKQINRTINRSIGTMLSSYCQALNKERNYSGSIFRASTKAISVNDPDAMRDGLNPRMKGIYDLVPKWQYPEVCFNYIHLNPVRSNLVKKPYEWEFSSARAYHFNNYDPLVDKQLAKEYIDYKN